MCIRDRNNPPVNAINRAIRQGLSEALAWAESQQLSRVILSGAGGVFAAGADAGEFDTPPEAPHLPDVLQQIETSPVPWIAALHGAVLGGGAELALACRYRLARADASIGFPEVILGVVPGAGGTQRLPRLVGMMAALRLIPTGRPVSGDAAQQIGLVDAICDDPLASALQITDDQLAAAVPGTAAASWSSVICMALASGSSQIASTRPICLSLIHISEPTRPY